MQKYNQALKEKEQNKGEQSSLKNALLQSQDLSVVREIGQTLDLMEQYQSKLTLSLRELLEPLGKAREEYLLAKRERESFDLLKKKELEKFLYAQKKKDQAILDEYGRNNYLKQF